MNARTSSGVYKTGFFAFLIGAVLIGALMGSVSYCFMDSDGYSKLALFQNGYFSARQSGDFGEILIKSFSGATLFMAAVFLMGFSAFGQPAVIAVLLIRGMGFGVTMAQFYSVYGKRGVLMSAVFVLPSAVITTSALAAGAREAVGLSNLLLGITLSDRQENGLRQAVRLYGAKFLVLEAVLAVGAGIECICTVLFMGRL